MLLILTCLLLTLPTADLLTVRGTLQDGAGQPVASALVRILPIDSRSHVEGPEAVSGMSGPDGSFELVLDETAHALRLDARAPGFAPALIDRIEPNLGRIDVGPLMLLPGVTITGRIDDPQGKPIAGAHLLIRSAFHRGLKDVSYEPAATTDKHGRYRIENLPPGKVSVGATASGRRFAVTKGVDLSDPFLRRIDFTLKPESPCNGIVTHAGQPVGNALIEVRRGGGPDVFFRPLVSTDERGRFEIPGLPELRDELRLRITAAGLNPTEFPVGSDPASNEYELESAPLVRIETAADGEAPAIDRVEFEVYTRTPDGWTREDGWVTEEDAQVLSPDVWIAPVPRGDAARFLVHAIDGRLTRTSDVRLDGSDQMVVAAFPTRLSVTGRVRSEGGDPVEGQRVELGFPGASHGGLRIARATLSDSEGRFRFDALDPGSYVIREFSRSGISEPARLYLSPDQDPGPIDLDQIRPATLKGHLRINGEPPVTSVLIRAYRFHRSGGGGLWREIASVRSDGQGAYEIAPLPPGTIALVPARPPEAADGSQHDRGTERPPAIDRRWPWMVRLEAGEQARLDFDAPFPERAWLTGTIHVNDTPRTGLPLTLRPLDGGLAESVRSGPAGHFRFRFEGGGRHELAVSGGPLSTTFVLDLEEGVDRTSRLTLRAGEVRGRIRWPEPRPRVQIRLELKQKPATPDEKPYAAQALLTPDAGGFYRFAEVLAGTGRVVVLDGSKRYASIASDPFQIESGRLVEVPELALTPANTLTAILKGPAGETLPFAALELRAAPGERKLPEPYVAWFVGNSATVHGLPPTKLIARVSPFGEWEASEEQVVQMPTDGSLVTVEFQVSRQKP